MGAVREMLGLKMKHKEKVALAVEKIKGDEGLVVELVDLLKTGSDVEKGTCAEVMKFISRIQLQNK